MFEVQFSASLPAIYAFKLLCSLVLAQKVVCFQLTCPVGATNCGVYCHANYLCIISHERTLLQSFLTDYSDCRLLRMLDEFIILGSHLIANGI